MAQPAPSLKESLRGTSPQNNCKENVFSMTAHVQETLACGELEVYFVEFYALKCCGFVSHVKARAKSFPVSEQSVPVGPAFPFHCRELQTDSARRAKKFIAHSTVREQAGYNSGVFSYINVRDNTKECHFSCHKTAAHES